MANSFSFSMATCRKNLLSTIMIMLGLLITISRHSTVAEVGVCYGRLGSNLPCPEAVVALYKQNNITKMRLYDPDPPTLRALGGSGIELLVGIPEADLPDLAQCQCHANDWVHAKIASYPNVKFRYIAVGNEVNTSSMYAPLVFPAMQHIYNALCEAGLESHIAVSTSIKTDLLEKSSPPSDGVFKSSVSWYIKPIVEFLRDTNAPLLANVYPYFAYMNDMENINLSFALLQPNSGVVLGCVYYDNLFYAIVDAVYSAMEKILAPSSSGSSTTAASAATKPTPKLTVSESGHSTPPKPPPKPQRVGDGDINTVENARIYNNNLMRIVKKGTPKRPGAPIETYIFAMFDEDLKPGPEYERHFGIFLPDGQPKYPLRFY
ncbi:glucan endo-1,3-beta-glucosidase, acidic-like [Salvia miltiorrhiza]|uniref:glucan endo-1,3-beta-glucosidase, acidic-like n=1 Tax=Salvia miltiorrhiza TaxID=226208 RepID=UPI0025ACEEC7|nr:glucan endo-1,3-beta-glucosidase, acidic-like [Salvia miltiorrhiza]